MLCPRVEVPDTAVTLMFTFTPSLRLVVNCDAAYDAAAFMFAMSAELKPALRNV